MLKWYTTWNKRPSFPYFMIFFSAIFYVLAIQSLMQVAKILPSGVGAIALIPTLIIEDLSPYFALFYLVLNIPLILLFYRKIRRRFIWRTIFFLVVSSLLNLLFLIPELNEFFTNIIVKHDPGKTVSQTVVDRVWPMWLLPGIAGVFVGFAIGISWKYGGSTGGSDIVVYYISTKHKKQVGSIGFIVSIVILFSTFGVLLSLDKLIRSVWLVSLIGSFIYIVTTSAVINFIYPKYSKVTVEIHSTKLKEIESWLDKCYPHSYRFESAISGSKKRPRQYIVTTMLLLEVRRFVLDVKALDPDCWISVTRALFVFGKFNTEHVDEI